LSETVRPPLSSATLPYFFLSLASTSGFRFLIFTSTSGSSPSGLAATAKVTLPPQVT
jgi:hypothetical protein